MKTVYKPKNPNCAQMMANGHIVVKDGLVCDAPIAELEQLVTHGILVKEIRDTKEVKVELEPIAKESLVVEPQPTVEESSTVPEVKEILMEVITVPEVKENPIKLTKAERRRLEAEKANKV